MALWQVMEVKIEEKQGKTRRKTQENGAGEEKGS